MKLREFGIELRGEDQESAIRLRTESRCITSLYERCFPSYTTEKTWKVMVEAVPFIVEASPPEDRLGVAAVQVVFDWESYLAKDAQEKKELLLEVLQQGVLSVCASWDWSTKPFQDTYTEIRNLSFVNRGIWRKPKSSPNRRFKAEIQFEYEIDRFTIELVLRDRSGSVVKTEKLVEETPNEFIFDKYLGELKWLSESEVALLPKRGDRRLSVSVP